MNEKIEELKKFIEQYAYDYLGEGITKKILDELNNGNQQLALELISAMDKNWIEEVKNVGEFRMFTTEVPVSPINQKEFKAHYKTDRMDDYLSGKKNIPVLKYVIKRQRDISSNLDLER